MIVRVIRKSTSIAKNRVKLLISVFTNKFNSILFSNMLYKLRIIKSYDYKR